MKEKEKNADPSGGEGGAMPTFKGSFPFPLLVSIESRLWFSLNSS